ncbi:MAG: isocitrate lyase/phosphoenolpyruvate mutase family protein [Actinocatenispora sp.]
MTASLGAAADRFRSLHRPGRPVVLPNAWDAASARIVRDAGFPAVATSSIAVAESLGYADGGGAPAAEMFAAAGRIAAAVDVPVTVDAEDGYGLPPEELVERLVSVGAVGCNLEDSTGGALTDVDIHAARLATVRAAAVRSGIPLVINARVDVFVRSGGTPEADLVDEAVARANRYLAAGADCAYPILCRREETMAALIERIDGPVNLHWSAEGPSVARLADLGVARVSTGGGLWASTMDGFRKAVGALA